MGICFGLGVGAGLLDNREIESFERDGYLILRGFFDKAEVAELRDATVEILGRAKRGAPGIGFDPWTTEPGDALNPNRVYYYNDIFLKHPRLDAHMRNPRLATVFYELYGSDIDAFQSATVVKPAMMNFDFQGWHQDAPDYIPLSNYKLSSALTYLGEMGPDTVARRSFPAVTTTGCLNAAMSRYRAGRSRNASSWGSKSTSRGSSRRNSIPATC